MINTLQNAGRPNANYFLRGWGPMYTNGQTYVIPYDPSNGTVSDGEIFYFN